MTFKHQCLAAAYLPLRLANNIRSGFLEQPGRLRVLLYHDIPKDEYELFRRQLIWLSERWQFVSTDTFSAMVSGELPVLKDSLLLTFDDGFKSCRDVAESILMELNIKALFFVVSDFVMLTGEEWKEFVATNINPDMQIEDVPEQCRNMSVTDLEFLLDQGHSIGGHTASHRRLSELNEQELGYEITASINKLEKLLSISLDHFAYTFGNLGSFSPTALALARKHCKYIHTGIRGDNALHRIPCSIYRDSLKPRDSLNLVGSFLEGGADRRYAKDRSKYREWCIQTDNPQYGEL